MSRPALPPVEPLTGDEILAAVPDELVMLAWFVGIFWSLIAAILVALWFALRRRREGKHQQD